KLVKLPADVRSLEVRIGVDKLVYVAQEENSTRPGESPPGFDWRSTYGLYLKAKESARERAYEKAADEFDACLKSDPNFGPALVEMASLANRRGDYSRALDYA